ncbi:hypothetical protein CM15mP35_04780 [bacterium]|nr:MAG: hypothetical protein CM15mV39_1090 [uncultured marine virus]GIR20217.1 MAG: hypothetical protein CM15mP35_04780 [bacterium]
MNYIIKWGSGIDNIDKKSAEINGIQIFNTPNILGKYVAEYGLGLLLSLIKQITKTDREVRKIIGTKMKTSLCIIQNWFLDLEMLPRIC